MCRNLGPKCKEKPSSETPGTTRLVRDMTLDASGTKKEFGHSSISQNRDMQQLMDLLLNQMTDLLARLWHLKMLDMLRVIKTCVLKYKAAYVAEYTAQYTEGDLLGANHKAKQLG